MKRLQLMHIGIYLCLSFFLVGSNMHDQTVDHLLRSLQEIGFTPEYYVLHHGGRTTKPMTQEQTDRLVRRLQMTLQSSPVQKQDDSEGIRYTTNGKIGRNLNLTLNVINDEPFQKRNHPYISIQVTGRGVPGPAFTSARKQVAELLRLNGIIPHFHTSIQGSKPFSATKLEEPIISVFQRLQAKEVESMRTDHTISVSAYSPLLGESLKTAGGLMNLQAATRVNHDSHRLILTLGTPIITIEY